MKKGFFFVWGFLVIGLFIVLIIFGLKFKKYEKYIMFKKEIKNVSKSYYRSTDDKKITYDKLIDYDEKLSDFFVDDNCEIKIIVHKKMFIKYINVKLKCDHYNN